VWLEVEEKNTAMARRNVAIVSSLVYGPVLIRCRINRIARLKGARTFLRSLCFRGSLLKGKLYRAICYTRQLRDIRADAS